MKTALLTRRRIVAASLAALVVAAVQASPSAAAALLHPSQAEKPIGALDYVRGQVALVRKGEEMPSPGPGDSLYDGDLVRTDSSSTATIAMDPSSGFSGSIVINPGTTFYLKRSVKEDMPHTGLDLMAGSLSAKVSKISGKPGLDVSTGLSTFGVRGTQFEIALSVNATLFAVCEEGSVAVTTGDAESPLPAGQAIQQAEEGPPVPITFEASSIGELRGKWLDKEGALFRRAPLKVLALFERRYSEHARAILGETRSLVLDPVFRKWIQEDRTGAAPDPLDPQVLRDKKRLMPKLVSLAKHIAVFERVYWRLNDMVDIVRNGEFSKQEIRKGLAVAKFVADFDRDRRDLERAIFVYHRALALYGERSPGSEDLLGTLGAGGLE